jgi:predicted dehydrogenase
MTTLHFGIIGCGLMGRELASAMARWLHLAELDVRVELVAVCDRNDERRQWLADRSPSVRQSTADYRELLANPAVEAVYCAVPHNLHRELYCAVIGAGKHLLGEKPFGMDRAANDAILACAAEQPRALVRSSSEFAFFPAAQRVLEMTAAGAFGRVIEVNSGFLHSSDLDPEKPVNWKRLVDVNGEYGVMGDLGLHACHVPFRAGWRPLNVRAVLSDIVSERPDGKGGRVPCRTWDNATLLCETADPAGGAPFPWTMRLQRISPGEKNTWYIEIKGTRACARFSTKNPKLLETLHYAGGEQSWQRTDTGYEPAFKAVTGGVFEFGFSDACLQMLAAFAYEAVHGRPLRPAAGCLTPEETALSHRLFTAALESHRRQATVAV